MFDVFEIFRGMGPIWLIWITGVAVLLGGFVVFCRRLRQQRWAALTGESGASYSLGFVFVAPIYLFFLLMVYESSLLLVAKVGTMYAAHAAARSAVVWGTAEPASLRSDKIDQAAWTAMTPFVGARFRDLDFAEIPNSAYLQSAELVAVYMLYSTGSAGQPAPAVRPYPRSNAPADYLVRKYLNAASRTRYTITADDNTPNADTTVVLRYQAPLYFPGVSRFLASNNSWPYEYTIESRAVLPNETPVSADRRLGIDYHSR
jgi:hypothetical protein